MATNLKEVNYSGEKLTVGAIEILGDITGGGIKTVRRAISDLAETVQTVAAETSDYWTAIASDLTITPTEKKQLKKEWNAITQAYSSICESATELNLNDYTEIKNYKATYAELYNYIFTTIKVFDNMAENTVIPSSETFNSLYAAYYDKEAKANQRIAIGQVDEDSGIRTISNLSVVGYDGEVAIYRNCFYQYSTSKNTWTELNTGVLYMGAFNYQPEGELNHFFLCYEETPYKAKLVVNGNVLANENNQKIIANLESFEAGYIYYYGSGGNWKKVTNKNDWRYIVAMNDLIKYGFSVSEYVEEYIQKNSHTAQYLGPLSTFPEEGEYKAGDWFMWAGATQPSEKVPAGKLILGAVYKYNSPTWTLLDPSEKTEEGFVKYSTELTAALNDILTSKQAGEGFFSTAFCDALISNTAFINKLAASIIKLQTDAEGNAGVIYGGERYNADGSDKDTSAAGFYLDTNGELKAQNAQMTGEVNATSGDFTGQVILRNPNGCIESDDYNFSKGVGFHLGFTGGAQSSMQCNIIRVNGISKILSKDYFTVDAAGMISGNAFIRKHFTYEGTLPSNEHIFSSDSSLTSYTISKDVLKTQIFNTLVTNFPEQNVFIVPCSGILDCYNSGIAVMPIFIRYDAENDNMRIYYYYLNIVNNVIKPVKTTSSYYTLSDAISGTIFIY